MRVLARVTTAGNTPLVVFRRDWVPGQMSSDRGVLDWPAGRELLTRDVVALCVASGDQYRATLDHGSPGGVYTLPGVIHPPAAGVRLTSAASCDPWWLKLAPSIPDCLFVRPLFVTGDPVLLQ